MSAIFRVQCETSGAQSTMCRSRSRAELKEALEGWITPHHRFLVGQHLRSWAGLTPRLDESAGKRRSTQLKKGAPWLKPVLVQCAFAAARAKNTYLQAQFLRLKARRGPKKAAIAVAASILTAVCHMLRDGTFYNDLGPQHFASHDKTRTAMRLVRRIKDLGYDVEIKAAA